MHESQTDVTRILERLSHGDASTIDLASACDVMVQHCGRLSVPGDFVTVLHGLWEANRIRWVWANSRWALADPSPLDGIAFAT